MADVNDIQNMLNSLGRAAGNVAEQLNRLDDEARSVIRHGYVYGEHRGTAQERAYKLKQELASKTLGSFAKAVSEAQESLKNHSANYSEVNKIITAQRVAIENNISKLYKNWDKLNEEFPKQVQSSINKVINSNSSFVSDILTDFNVSTAESAMVLNDLTERVVKTINSIKQGKIFDIEGQAASINNDMLNNIKNLTLTQITAIRDALKTIDPVAGVVAGDIIDQIKQGHALSSDQIETLITSLSKISQDVPDVSNKLTTSLSAMASGINDTSKNVIKQISNIGDFATGATSYQEFVLDELLATGKQLDSSFEDKISRIITESAMSDAKKQQAEQLYRKYLNTNVTGVKLSIAEQTEITEYLNEITPQLEQLLDSLIDVNQTTMNTVNTQMMGFKQQFIDRLENDFGSVINGLIRGGNRLEVASGALQTMAVDAAIKSIKAAAQSVDDYLNMYRKQLVTGVQAFNPFEQVATTFSTLMDPKVVQELMIVNKDYVQSLAQDYDSIAAHNASYDKTLNSVEKSTEMYVDIIDRHTNEFAKMTGFSYDESGKLVAQTGYLAKLLGNDADEIDSAITKSSKVISDTAKYMAVTPQQMLSLIEETIADSDVQGMLLNMTESQRENFIVDMSLRAQQNKAILGSTEAALKFEKSLLKAGARLTPQERLEQWTAMKTILPQILGMAQTRGIDLGKFATMEGMQSLESLYMKGFKAPTKEETEMTADFQRIMTQIRELGSKGRPEDQLLMGAWVDQLTEHSGKIMDTMMAPEIDLLKRQELGAKPGTDVNVQINDTLKSVNDTENKLINAIVELTSRIKAVTGVELGGGGAMSYAAGAAGMYAAGKMMPEGATGKAFEWVKNKISGLGGAAASTGAGTAAAGVTSKISDLYTKIAARSSAFAQSLTNATSSVSANVGRMTAAGSRFGSVAGAVASKLAVPVAVASTVYETYSWMDEQHQEKLRGIKTWKNDFGVLLDTINPSNWEMFGGVRPEVEITPDIKVKAEPIDAQPVFNPVDAKPIDTQPVFNPVDAKPIDTQPVFNPVDAKPIDTQPVFNPVDAKPIDTQPTFNPVDAKPIDAQPVFNPVDAKPIDTQPVFNPVNAKPIDTQPVFNPVDAKPIDAQPVFNPVDVKPIDTQPVFNPVDVKPIDTQPVFNPVDAKPIDAQPVFNPVDVKPIDVKPTFTPIGAEIAPVVIEPKTPVIQPPITTEPVKPSLGDIIPSKMMVSIIEADIFSAKSMNIDKTTAPRTAPIIIDNPLKNERSTLMESMNSLEKSMIDTMPNIIMSSIIDSIIPTKLDQIAGVQIIAPEPQLENINNPEQSVLSQPATTQTVWETNEELDVLSTISGDIKTMNAGMTTNLTNMIKVIQEFYKTYYDDLHKPTMPERYPPAPPPVQPPVNPSK